MMTMNLNPASFTGTDLTITEYPNPVLRRRGDDIAKFDDALRQTCKEMITIMYEADGVGLAAPQVNLSLRLFVYNPTGDVARPELERIVCNPRIVTYSDTVVVDCEGCLSSRSGRCEGSVCRAKELMVEYQDEDGRKIRKKLTGFEAIVFQHEFDHVEGILHFDRFAPEDRTNIQPELEIMIGEYTKGDGVLEPDATVFKSLKPPPLVRKGWMPPIELPSIPSLLKPKSKNKSKPAVKAGFGAGGGGMGGGIGKGKKKKK